MTQPAEHTTRDDRAIPRMWRLLALAAVAPFLVAAVLWRLGVALGVPGRLVYEYSPVLRWRLGAVPAAVGCAAVVGLAVWLLAARRRAGHTLGLGLLAIGLVGVGFWTYLAPPDHLKQHIFNMESPAQDGAFTREVAHIESLRQYLREFPQRARSAPAEMRGTRVISNPPAMTLLAWGAQRLVSTWGPLRETIRSQIERQGRRDDATATAPIEVDEAAFAAFQERAAVGLAFCWLLTLMWLLAAVPLYALGRLFLSRPGAAVFCVGGLVSPMTLLFAPGKDVAQVLTVALPLWLWFLTLRRGWRWAAGLAGALGLAACMVSLVHVWVGVIVVVASFLWAYGLPGQGRRLLWRGVLPATVGVLLAAVALYVLCDLNVAATAVAVARSQGDVTRGVGAMPIVWQLLGVPLFLLFAGPALWTGLLWLSGGQPGAGLQPENNRLASCLLVCTVVVLLGTVGFTNVETPRLWIAFVPLLLLGLSLRLDALRASPVSYRWLLAGLAAVQVVFSALHWALMDMRGAENRLLSGHFFW